MQISVKHPDGRVPLVVLDERTPWRVSRPGHAGEALLDPREDAPAFLAEAYPRWLAALCERADADRQLAIAVVAEVRRRRGR
ncbi:MAG: hypothetical protein KF729_19120 [Sandaracinaceae bacterium]|nr:hypothetical protein [Sandaracinaceae bacterium]